MGKVAAIIILLFLFIPFSRGDSIPDFKTADSVTYALYENGYWEELTIIGKNVLKSGIDYYYLRMRLGIAFYELQNYLNAISHFEKALEFNSMAYDAQFFLYYCYSGVNRYADAEQILSMIPESKRENLKTQTIKPVELLYFDAGPTGSNNLKRNDTIDLDGVDNIFGETTLRDDAFYSSFGLRQRWTRNIRSYYSYQYYRSNNTKKIRINNYDTINHPHKLNQNQFYINTSLRFLKAWSVTAAFHYIHVTYSTYESRFDPKQNRYQLAYDPVTRHDFLFSLDIERDIHIYKIGVFGSYGSLNNQNPYQAGFSFLIFPMGNLDMYFHSRLINHSLDGEYKIIFYQMAGVKLSTHLWTEGFVTLGDQLNYNDKNGYLVYNSPDKTKYKWGLKLIAPYNKISVSVDFQFFENEGEILTYRYPDDPWHNQIYSDYVNYSYQNFIILGGILWKI